MSELEELKRRNTDARNAALSTGITGMTTTAFLASMFYDFSLGLYGWAILYGFFGGLTMMLFLVFLALWSQDS